MTKHSRTTLKILFVTRYVAGCLPSEFTYHGEWTDTFELILSIRKLEPSTQIFLVTPKVREEHSGRFNKEFGKIMQENSVLHLFSDTYLYSIPPPLFRWKLFLKEKEIVHKFGIDIIQYGQFGLIYSCLFKKSLALRKIICYGCYDYDREWPDKTKDLAFKRSISKFATLAWMQSLPLHIFAKMYRLRTFDKRVDHFVLMHPSGYEHLTKDYPSLNITLITKGHNNPSIVSPRKKKRAKNVLFLGFLQYRKGIPDLLSVAEATPDLNFNIAGSGNTEIEDMVKKSAAKFDNIRFLGAVDYYEKWKIYQQNDILLHPSYKDTFPSTILEALSCGLPVITTYGIDSPIKDGENGLLFQAGNLEELGDKLNILSTNLGLYEQMSKAAILTAQQYTWDGAAQYFLKLYYG